ncbi:unnamed protein product [Prunus armeniaca]
MNMLKSMMNTLSMSMNMLNMSESEEASEYVCSEEESSQTDSFVEGLIEARMGVHEGEMAGPSVESGSEAYRKMQKKYKVLEASVDRVLALAHTPEVGSSNQTSPSESVGIAMVSASEGVDIRVGVPLGNQNTLTEAKLVELRTDYSVPSYVGMRLPSAADVVRYPPEGSVMIFTDMYQHGLRLPFHPWVQMMLAKLGYAPGQYNPNFWLLLHGVYIAWWLVGLGEPTFEQFMYLYSISKQQGTFGWVQANCRKAKERGYFIGHKPSTQKSWRNRWCLAYGDWECPPGKTVSRHIPTHFQSIGSVKWGPISKEREDEVERVRSLLSETQRELRNLVTQKNLYESGLLQGMAGIIRGSTKVAMDLDDPEMQKRLRESRAKKAEKGGAQQAAGRRSRDEEGLVSDVLGKKRALEEAHRSVMGTGPRLPPFDPQAPPKLPFGMDDVYAEGVEKVDFSGLRRQKKEVNLAMHRQEVPLVNVFLEGVKSDPEVLARTPATSYADRAQKTLLTQAYAYGEMYVNMAKADKEIQRLKRRNEMAKDKVAEAQEAIREKNTLVLQKAAMAKEMEELKRSRVEEVAAARVEAIESFRGSDELRNYIMDQMVAMQLGWEERVAMFNPSVEINFDTSGEPPSSSRTTDVVPEPEPEPAITDAPSTES